MKIAVLVKQVIGSESALDISDDSSWVKEENASFVMNPPDHYAIEEALAIKEKIGEVEVVIVSQGPARVQKVIREELILIEQYKTVATLVASTEKRMLAEGYSRDEINEGIMDMLGGIGGGYISYIKQVSKIIYKKW